jgi:DNA-binding transcriptional LysR family regulator
MLDLNDFFYFVQVVERRGFTAAGRVLGMPKSTLSYRVNKLEAELGVRLINSHVSPFRANSGRRGVLSTCREHRESRRRS